MNTNPLWKRNICWSSWPFKRNHNFLSQLTWIHRHITQRFVHTQHNKLQAYNNITQYIDAYNSTWYSTFMECSIRKTTLHHSVWGRRKEIISMLNLYIEHRFFFCHVTQKSHKQIEEKKIIVSMSNQFNLLMPFPLVFRLWKTTF